MALLPYLSWLDKGKKYFDRTGSVHLLSDDCLHLLHGSKAKGKIRVDPRRQFPNHPCPEHQLMTRNLCLGGDFFQGRKKIMGVSHFKFSLSIQTVRWFHILDTSTAPAPGVQHGVKSAAQYQPRATPGL
jgi:hypothetical protein